MTNTANRRPSIDDLLDMILDDGSDTNDWSLVDDLELLADDRDEVGARLDTMTDGLYDEVDNPAPADIIEAVRTEAACRLQEVN